MWTSPGLTVMRSCTGFDEEDPHAAVPAVVACTCFFAVCPVGEEPDRVALSALVTSDG